MKKYLQYICALVLAVVFGILYSCERQEATVDVVALSTEENKVESVPETVEENVETICVHVIGYVKNPGVYHVQAGSRVYEVIALAGGFLQDADKDYLNQAAVLSDGQKLRVYSKEEAATLSVNQIEKDTAEATNKLVNINTASKEELMTLPGIGESRAESIIAYREENGGFNTIEDIMKVSGIKDAAFSKIKKYICTN